LAFKDFQDLPKKFPKNVPRGKYAKIGQKAKITAYLSHLKDYHDVLWPTDSPCCTQSESVTKRTKVLETAKLQGLFCIEKIAHISAISWRILTSPVSKKFSHPGLSSGQRTSKSSL